MFSDLTPLYPLVVPFLLVLFRVVGLFVFVPVFSNSAIPANVEGVVVAGDYVVRVERGAEKTTVPATLIGLVVAIAGEMSVGLIDRDTGRRGVCGGTARSAYDQPANGLSLSAIYDPSFEDQSTVIEQIAFWIALVTFLSMGGHREVINAIVYSYSRVPMGGGGISADVILAADCGSLDAAFHAAARSLCPARRVFHRHTDRRPDVTVHAPDEPDGSERAYPPGRRILHGHGRHGRLGAWFRSRASAKCLSTHRAACSDKSLW